MQEKFLIFVWKKKFFLSFNEKFSTALDKVFYCSAGSVAQFAKASENTMTQRLVRICISMHVLKHYGFFNTHKGYALSMFPRILHRCRRLKLSLAFRGLFRPVWDLVDAFGIPFPRHCTFAKLNEWFKSRSSLDQLLTSWKDGRETRSSFNLESSTGFASAAI